MDMGVDEDIMWPFTSLTSAMFVCLSTLNPVIPFVQKALLSAAIMPDAQRTAQWVAAILKVLGSCFSIYACYRYDHTKITHQNYACVRILLWVAAVTNLPFAGFSLEDAIVLWNGHKPKETFENRSSAILSFGQSLASFAIFIFALIDISHLAKPTDPFDYMELIDAAGGAGGHGGAPAPNAADEVPAGRERQRRAPPATKGVKRKERRPKRVGGRVRCLVFVYVVVVFVYLLVAQTELMEKCERLAERQAQTQQSMEHEIQQRFDAVNAVLQELENIDNSRMDEAQQQVLKSGTGSQYRTPLALASGGRTNSSSSDLQTPQEKGTTGGKFYQNRMAGTQQSTPYTRTPVSSTKKPSHWQNLLKKRAVVKTVLERRKSAVSIYELRAEYERTYEEPLKIAQTFGTSALEFFQTQFGNHVQPYVRQSVLYLTPRTQPKSVILPPQPPPEEQFLPEEEDEDILDTLANELKALSNAEEQAAEGPVAASEQPTERSNSPIATEQDPLLLAFETSPPSLASELNVSMGHQILLLNGVQFFGLKHKWHTAIQLLVENCVLKRFRLYIAQTTCPEFMRLFSFLVFELRPERLVLETVEYWSDVSALDAELLVASCLNACQRTLRHVSVRWPSESELNNLLQVLASCVRLEQLQLCLAQPAVSTPDHQMLHALDDKQLNHLCLYNLPVGADILGRICASVRSMRLDRLPHSLPALNCIEWLTLDADPTMNIPQLFIEKMPNLHTLTLIKCNTQILGAALRYVCVCRSGSRITCLRLNGLTALDGHMAMLHWLQQLTEISLRLEQNSMQLTCGQAIVVFVKSL